MLSAQTAFAEDRWVRIREHQIRAFAQLAWIASNSPNSQDESALISRLIKTALDESFIADPATDGLPAATELFRSLQQNVHSNYFYNSGIHLLGGAEMSFDR